MSITNIPTELLRALIAVVDHRSFTKAAMTLGITQPAVSAQIKRLQYILGAEVFDRTTQGIKLTPQGEVVVSYARRLLSINDQILRVGGEGPRPELVVRVGTPSDFVASLLPRTLAHLRARWPDVRFIVRTGFFEVLARELRNGELDLLVGLTLERPHDARYHWPLETAWVRGLGFDLDRRRPIPLVTYGEDCVYHKLAVQSLQRAKLAWEDVFTGPSMMSLASAVVSGLGVMPIIRRRAGEFGMLACEEGPLPRLPSLYSGIYMREGGAHSAYEQLADELADVLSPDVAVEPMLASGMRQRTPAA